MDDAQADRAAFDTAERLPGHRWSFPWAQANHHQALTCGGSPPGTLSWDSGTRTGLDARSRALVSVTIAATPGTREPLRGQLRIALSNGVTKDEIVDLFIHLEAYAGAARAFDSYQIALEIFAETTGTE